MTPTEQALAELEHVRWLAASVINVAHELAARVLAGVLPLRPGGVPEDVLACLRAALERLESLNR